jgi:ABC-2 type transport system permease protein
MGNGLPSLAGMPILLITLLLISTAVTALSLGLSFALPGHVELLAITLLVNLPLLFTSTALAPLNAMPNWLRWVASLNPLSWAIEPIRSSYNHHFSWNATVLQTPFASLSNTHCLILLTIFSAACLMAIRPLVNRKLA